MTRTLRKEVFYPHPIDSVWTALTDSRALAEWLMPNNFEPVVGKVFRYHVDPMPGFSGISECQVLEVDRPRRLVYTWTPLPKRAEAPRPAPMTLVWTLTPAPGGTRLVLEQSGLESLGWWSRISMTFGWGRMLKRLLPRVLKNVRGTDFTPGAVPRRDYGTKTVPDGYSK
jgi:uncharacterized protein YndB with AHSA1/START domain